MLKTLLKPGIQELLRARKWEHVGEVLGDWPAPEVASFLHELEKPDRVLIFRAMPAEFASEVFAHLETGEQDSLVRELTDEETRELLDNLWIDDRTLLLAELPGQVTQRLLNLLPPKELAQARQLLGYPEWSVGRLMTPEYIAVRPDWTVARALTHIRARGKDSETINQIYVTDSSWRLLDDIPLRRLILASDEEKLIRDLMDHHFVSVLATQEQEEAVQTIRRYSLVALPVTDSRGILLGIVTVDDLLEVAVEEATEDFHRVASIAPLPTSVKEAGYTALYRSRIGWLLTLVFVNILSGATLASFEGLLAEMVALVFFLPLLIASAGNAGSQASTLMVRAMATGEVQLRDWFSLLGKELVVSGGLGLTMAVAVSLIGTLRGGPDVAVVVGLTMVVVVVLGSLIGMSLPFLLNRFEMDPATASTPLVTSIADITGVLVYLSLASWYFSHLVP